MSLPTTFLLLTLFLLPLCHADSPLATLPPFPTPCVPSLTPSFSHTRPTVTEPGLCPAGKRGRDITVSINDGCTFFTFELRFCAVSRPVAEFRDARKCARRRILSRCAGRGGAFFKCVLNVTGRCFDRENVLSEGAVA